MSEEKALSLDTLVAELYSSSSESRRKAADELRQRGEQVAAALIETLMKDATPLRRAAAEIVREWHEYVPVEPLLALRDTNAEVRSTAMWALAEMGERVQAEALLPFLADPDTGMQVAAFHALGERVPVATVLDALSSSEVGIRNTAAYIAGLLEEGLPVEPLVDMLRSEDAGIRVAATEALRNLGNRVPVAPLLEALHDTDVNVRLNAIDALANLGEQMPVEALRALLDDADTRVCRRAAKALLRVGEPAALAFIIRDLHADHEWARESALIRLAESTEKVKEEIARHLPMEELLHLLRDEWWPVGYMAGEFIAVLGEQAPFEELVAVSGNPLPPARWAALYTLELLGDRLSLSEYISIEPLLGALDAEDAETRRGAAAVLRSFGQRVPVEKLLPLIEVENHQVALTAAMLGRQEGIDALVAGLHTIENAGGAAAALQQLGSRVPAEPLLLALSNSERQVRQAAAEALYKTHPEILPQVVPELVETLCYGRVGRLLEPLRQVLIVRALSLVRSPEPLLVEWLDQALDSPSWEVRARAALGLGWMKQSVSDQTMQKLRRCQDDLESPSVRKAARMALEALGSPLPSD